MLGFFGERPRPLASAFVELLLLGRLLFWDARTISNRAQELMHQANSRGALDAFAQARLIAKQENQRNKIALTKEVRVLVPKVKLEHPYRRDSLVRS